jgi:hypothetical protein
MVAGEILEIALAGLADFKIEVEASGLGAGLDQVQVLGRKEDDGHLSEDLGQWAELFEVEEEAFGLPALQVGFHVPEQGAIFMADLGLKEGLMGIVLDKIVGIGPTAQSLGGAQKEDGFKEIGFTLGVGTQQEIGFWVGYPVNPA